jgi:hypothetical protein
MKARGGATGPSRAESLGGTTRGNTPDPTETEHTEYTADVSPPDDPTPEEVIAEYRRRYIEIRLDYSGRRGLVEGAHGYQWSRTRLDEMILKYIAEVRHHLGCRTIELLREFLECTVLECDRSHAMTLAHEILWAAVESNVPGPHNTAPTQWDMSQLDYESVLEFHRAYWAAYKHNEGWEDCLEYLGRSVPASTVHPPVYSLGAKICAKFKRMSVGDLRVCLRDILPESHMRAVVDIVSDEDLRNAVLEEYEETRGSGAGDIVLY